MYTRPAFVRRGVGRLILRLCEEAAVADLLSSGRAPRARLRELLAAPAPLVAPGAYDALSARLADLIDAFAPAADAVRWTAPGLGPRRDQPEPPRPPTAAEIDQIRSDAQAEGHADLSGGASTDAPPEGPPPELVPR